MITAPFFISAMLSPGFRLAGAALGLGVPAIVARIHGEKAGYADPTKGGMGGTLGYGLMLNPLAGIAYGQGHAAGRERAKDAAIQNLQTLGAIGAGVVTQGGQLVYPDPEAAQAAYQLMQNPQMINPYQTNVRMQ